MAMTVGELNVEIGARLDKFERGMKQMHRGLKESDRGVKQNTRSLGTFGKALVGAFSVGVLMNFGKKVVDITAEFQKLEAVLTNTLGSQSDAQIAMMQIQQFAASTPFSVKELTQSFVKLANQGFKPTVNEMTRLGDLAASTGKSFDQLAEAIIDAQTGEFERLKEFGIRAEKQGNKVTFAFKGVKTQVDFTSESIQKYLLGLGEVEGVSGATAAISGTLGGKISNLGDNMDMLFATIGAQGDGVMNRFLDSLNSMISTITMGIKSVKQLKEEVALMQLGEQMAEDQKEVEALALRYLDLGIEVDKTSALIRAAQDIAAQYNTIIQAGTSANVEGITKQKEALDELVTSLRLAQFQAANVGSAGRPQEGQVNLPSKGLPGAEAILNLAKPEIMEPIKSNLDMVDQKLNKSDSTAQRFGDSIVNGFINAVQAGKSFGDTLTDMFKKLLVSIGKFIAKLLVTKALMSIFGGPIGGLGAGMNVLGVPGLASGGVVTGPTLAMIGEGNEDEAVLPLSKLKGMIGMGSGSGSGPVMARLVNAGEDLLVILDSAKERQNSFRT